MKQSFQIKSGIKLLALVIQTWVSISAVQAATDSNKYTFDYAVKGQPSVAPIQVFDNGNNTYFQFQQDKALPAIFAVTNCGTKILINAEPDGGYVVVQGRYSKYVLQLAGKSAHVDFVGKVALPLQDNLPIEECDDSIRQTQGAPANRVYSAVRPAYGDDVAQAKRRKIDEFRKANSSASRVYQDGAWRVSVEPITPTLAPNVKVIAPKLEQTAANQPASNPSTATGTMLVTTATQVVKPESTLSASLSPSETIVPSVQIPVVETWEIKAGQSIKRNLDAWRTRAGWEMVWQYDGDFIAQAGATFTGDFQSAVKNLVAAMPESINMKIELATNKLVFVTKGAN